jgi:hypothetical protein
MRVTFTIEFTRDISTHAHTALIETAGKLRFAKPVEGPGWVQGHRAQVTYNIFDVRDIKAAIERAHYRLAFVVGDDTFRLVAVAATTA